MGIEARGAKCPYVYHLSASQDRGRGIAIGHSVIFDVADSEDEAYGRVMRAANLAYPQGDGWSSQFAIVTSLAGIDWIGRHDFSKIKQASQGDA